MCEWILWNAVSYLHANLFYQKQKFFLNTDHGMRQPDLLLNVFSLWQAGDLLIGKDSPDTMLWAAGEEPALFPFPGYGHHH